MDTARVTLFPKNSIILLYYIFVMKEVLYCQLLNPAIKLKATKHNS